MAQSGLFVGLITLDFLYLAPEFPRSNQKIVAADFTVAAGGPATNAAVTFAHLGNPAKVCGVLGCDPLAAIIRAELSQQQVEIIDLLPDSTIVPPISSVIITQGTGDRAVISLNASKNQAGIENLSPENLAGMLVGMGLVLIDGHQLEVGLAIAKTAQSLGIPTVLDGGSWKQGLEKLLPSIDYAICSSNFHPPNCANQSDVIAYLTNQKIKHVAITKGAESIIYLINTEINNKLVKKDKNQNNPSEHELVNGDQYPVNYQTGKIKIPQTLVVDTLGAGDIYHGAFCYYLLNGLDFISALAAAVKIARKSCCHFGTRSWMNSL